MRSRLIIGIIPLALALEACLDSTVPPDPASQELTLDFCASGAPVFFAIQNEGQGWQRVIAQAGNTFVFQATRRVAIAMTFDFGSSMVTDIYYTTAEELLPLSAISCTEVVGTKIVHGTVSNVAAGGRAVVSMSGADAQVASPTTGFSLTDVVDGAQDLVAHRDINALSTDVVPDRVIVRRALNPTHGATLDALNFNTEGDEPDSHVLTIGGMAGGEDTYFDVDFVTGLGTSHTLYQSPIFSTSPRVLHGIPSAFTQSGDLHELVMNGDAPSGLTYRSVRHWYRISSNKSLSFAAALSVPTISVVATSPYVRMRAQLPGQLAYPSFATAFFIQDTRSMYVTVTDGYAEGTPSTWTLEIPDLTAAAIPSTATLDTGESTTTTVEAYDGSIANIFGGALTDGAVMRFAGRSSTTFTRQMGRTPGARAERRPILNRRAFTR